MKKNMKPKILLLDLNCTKLSENTIYSAFALHKVQKNGMVYTSIEEDT